MGVHRTARTLGFFLELIASQAFANVNGRAVSAAHLVPQSNFAGAIHSVFATACNIAVGDLLITVHDAAKQHTPTSVRVAVNGTGCWTPVVRVGDRASFTAGWLSFGAHTLDLRQIPVWTPAERPRTTRRMVARARLAQLLSAHQIPVARTSSALTFTLARDVAALREIVIAPPGTRVRSEEIDAVIRRLIGAGEGLTPSGDDVLVGLLAALSRGVDSHQTVPIFAPIAEAVLRNTHRTTDVSAHHLKLATREFFGEPLINLIDAVVSGASLDAVHARTGEVLSVGASSGADALVGVLLGLQAALDFPLNKKAA